MDSQREILKRLWREFGGDQDRVIQEYARAELAGRVDRISNTSMISSFDYAKLLIKDGLAKGWLETAITEGEHQDLSPVIPSSQPASSNPIREFPFDETKSEKMKWAEYWFRKANIPPESQEYLSRVDAWRLAWRPQRVRILLIAESHVAEQSGDLEVKVFPQKGLGPNLALPSGFCRLVYCLGYGENQICRPNVQTKNSGTPQFWNLFSRIAAGFNSSINPEKLYRTKSTSEERFSQKIKVLIEFQKAGIWLEDASVIGLYPILKSRLDTKSYYKLIRESFLNFVWPGVERDNPEQVWVIGRGVGKVLEGLPMISSDTVISQPQDHNVNRYKKDVERLVDEVSK